MTLRFPFSGIVGQEQLKLALLLLAIDPGVGGVLIRGERGTAKTTAARALAALLPATAAGRAAPFVELPLGATEDRIIGAMDLSRVLQDGSTQLRSGLLARAHEGVLYVDEVNLLPDHLVDLLLDAAASGWVSIERDGISAAEAAHFVLIGTMNPEEGELRPQFLDRFGLCVQVAGLRSADERIAAIRQRLAFDAQPTQVLGAAQRQEDALRAAIVEARARLDRYVISDAHLALVARLTQEHDLEGIRGDLAIIKAARALAAWEAAPSVMEEHLARVAELALTHRRRCPGPSGAAPAPLTRGAPVNHSPPADAATREETVFAPQTPRLQAAPAAIGVPDAHLFTAMIDPDQVGRRGQEALAARRVVGVSHVEHTGTLAVTQSLQVAAGRGARVALRGVALERDDLRQHQRRGPGRCHVLFLVDASGSMATQRRLQLAKSAALGLLASSYQRRDEVALMVFRGEGSELVLPFTRHTAKIEQALREVPTGGRTPLARALLDARDVLRTRQPSLLVLLTDGRANVALEFGDPWQEALTACAALKSQCGAAWVIDCELGPVTLGRAQMLAQALGASCIALDALDGDGLALRIRQRVETP